MGCGGSTEAGGDGGASLGGRERKSVSFSAGLDEVSRAPESFALILSGHHDHPDCNGRYVFGGEENGKPKWVKEGRGGSPKLFWTGHSWDCFWGGYSPESRANTPVPPLNGYDNDKGGCEIRVRYEAVKKAPPPGIRLGDVAHRKPGRRLTHAESEAYANQMGGRLLTLAEARAAMNGRALYPGEDQWCAVQGRDWVQVGDRHHHPGKSHVQDCHHYPPWGDNANDQTYGNPSWNHVALWTTNGGGTIAGSSGGAADGHDSEATFFIDDWVTGVYYNGEDLTTRANSGQCSPTQLRFTYVPGAVLCIKGWDNQSGSAAGLFLHVTSPAGDFVLRPDDARCAVFAADGDTPPKGWVQNGFDDGKWQRPKQHVVWSGWHQHLPADLRSKGVGGGDGVWNGHKKHNFFRVRLDGGGGGGGKAVPLKKQVCFAINNGSPLDEGGWELYLVNDGYHKDQLRLGANAAGYGSPGHSAHKMGEANFDAKAFTEVLAVGSDGSWAHIVRQDGGRIPASDAFKVGAAHGYKLRFSNGHEQSSPGNDPWGAQGNHGPFFVDVWHQGRVEAGQWMWCDAEFGGPGRPRMGKILGTSGACFADEQGGFVWKWYGRSGLEPAAATTSAPVVIMGTVMGTAVSAASASAPPLVEMVNVLKRELGIEGNLSEVVGRACRELGVSTEGKTLMEQASECWVLVNGAN